MSRPKYVRKHIVELLLPRGEQHHRVVMGELNPLVAHLLHDKRVATLRQGSQRYKER